MMLGLYYFVEARAAPTLIFSTSTINIEPTINIPYFLVHTYSGKIPFLNLIGFKVPSYNAHPVAC